MYRRSRPRWVRDAAPSIRPANATWRNFQLSYGTAFDIAGQNHADGEGIRNLL